MRLLPSFLLLVLAACAVTASQQEQEEHYASKLKYNEALKASAGPHSPEQVTEGCSARRSCGECCRYGSIESANGYGLDPWYEKVLTFRGFVIASKTTTCDAALYEAALTLDRQIQKRPDLLDALIADGVHMAILGSNEVTLDVPEYSGLDAGFNSARGLGATRWIPVTSCAEENLLCLAGDSYAAENICSHENAHSLTGAGYKLDAPRYKIAGDSSSGQMFADFEDLYQSGVVSAGLWSNTYAATNAEEFMAEGVQSFYNANTEGPAAGDGVHNDINTRSELQSYQPGLYTAIDTYFSSEVTGFPCPTNDACDCSTFQCPEPVSLPIPNNPVPSPTFPSQASPIPDPVPSPTAPSPTAPSPTANTGSCFTVVKSLFKKLLAW